MPRKNTHKSPKWHWLILSPIGANANNFPTTSFYVKLQGDSGGPVFIPVVVEKEDFSLTEEEILNLVRTNKTKNSGKTEAEILNNLVRDPILIGVTR